MKDRQPVSRRTFLGRSAGLGIASAAAGLLTRPASAEEKPVSPNDRIRLGFIGVGSRGSQLVDAFLHEPSAEIAGLCDVWNDQLDACLAKYSIRPKTFSDYRDLLADDAIDAVVIATPPHWHALQTIHACEAGKDIYLEKPMTLSVGESLAVLRAVRKHDRITQIGTQIHAEANYRRVVDIVRSGALGRINVVRTLNTSNQGPHGIGHAPNSDPPKGLDWDMWCGPGPMRPFNPLIIEGAHQNCSFLEYSGGHTPGMAPHIIDLPYWALNLGHPTCVSSSGGRYLVNDAGNGYDTHEVLWQFPDMTMTWSTSIVNTFGMSFPEGRRRTLAIAFQGVDGTLVTDYGSHDIYEERDVTIDATNVPTTTKESPGHYGEFLDCVRSRTQPSCHIGYHYKIDVAIHLSLISLKLRRSVRFDPEKEEIPHDREASKLLYAPYRDPWKLPREYT